MSEGNFTPVPWEWSYDEDKSTGDYCILKGADGRKVLYPEDQFGGYSEEGKDLRIVCVNPDDERLIASAPDLLEALEKAKGLADEISRAVDFDEAEYIAAKIYDLTEAAIQKAKGQ